MNRSTALALIALALTASCGSGQRDPGPGPVSADEARTLREASEMVGAPTPSPGAPSREASPPPSN